MDTQCKLNLELFEGPLDLLLYLIKKSDMDINNIPIAAVLDQYMSYLEIIRDLDIDLAGDFILMASELAHIKSKMLLHEEDAFDEEEADPRADLIARLIEYQKYKNAALWIYDRPWLARDVFTRPRQNSETPDAGDDLLEIEPFVLLTVFHEIVKKAPQAIPMGVAAQKISVEERIYQLVDKIKDVESCLFEELFDGDRARSAMVITFLAILEMTRLKMIQVYQMEYGASIRVRRVMDMADTDYWKRRVVEGVDDEEGSMKHE